MTQPIVTVMFQGDQCVVPWVLKLTIEGAVEMAFAKMHAGWGELPDGWDFKVSWHGSPQERPGRNDITTPADVITVLAPREREEA